MESFVKYFSLLMSLAYIALGAVIASGSPLFGSISRKYTLVFGGLMIIYGLYRGYRVYQKYFTTHE
ncbi:MAG: hypothetical protein QM734_06625 [Cyclobacteriaceae bacterium]